MFDFRVPLKEVSGSSAESTESPRGVQAETGGDAMGRGRGETGRTGDDRRPDRSLRRGPTGGGGGRRSARRAGLADCLATVVARLQGRTECGGLHHGGWQVSDNLWAPVEAGLILTY